MKICYKGFVEIQNLFFIITMEKIFEIENNLIKIKNCDEFDIEHILECGQIFTYEKKGDDFVVFSNDYVAKITKVKDTYLIASNNAQYFVNFFDLNTDYNQIKQQVAKILTDNKFDIDIQEMFKFGNGIRILKQSFCETVIGFIISANNNIPRIKKSMQYIRKNLGEKKCFENTEYYTFPSLQTLSEQNEYFFESAGCGYRAKSLVSTIKILQNSNFDELSKLDTPSLKNILLSYSGIGPKVADCILLFCFGRMDVFPVDTWVKKVYFDLYKQCPNEKIMAKTLVDTFGRYAGYAQQYMFYYKRNKKV